MNAKTDTNPNRPSLCVLLARGDHVSGMLLDRICHWAQYGKATIKDVDGKWIANDRIWWMREAQLSPGQSDRSIAKLTNLGLIEKRQHPFAGRNIMHVRPSTLTKDIIASAKTWDMASEIMTKAGIPLPEWFAGAGTQIFPSLTEMLAAWGEEVTPEEIGKLAVFHKDIKAVTKHDLCHDFTEIVLPLIKWAKANWEKISTKEAPKPSLAHFCEGLYVKALDVTIKETAPNEFGFDPA
jgi:hypothetical protein